MTARSHLPFPALFALAACGCGRDPRPPFGPAEQARLAQDLRTDAATATRMCGRPTPGLEHVEMQPLYRARFGELAVSVRALPVAAPEPRAACSAQLTIRFVPKVRWDGRRSAVEWRFAEAKVDAVFTPGAEWFGSGGGGHGGRRHHWP